ncbi:MAG: isocitrate/isopropylmalate family dehydrogenase, partial [Chloroflexota bacterium]|nr:isocitrate/isopropylmalate family dehydrogenase [Chloroflexota bacterium]
AGQDIANPLGTILSAAMMLRWSLGRADAADAMEAAVNGVLADGVRTNDLMPSDPAEAATCTVVGTKEMARVIGDRIAI